MASYQWPPKDPQETDYRHVIWCSLDGTNTDGATDTGELQGATISTATWTVPSGITKVSSNQNITTIQGISYGINTVTNILRSGGTADTDYDLTIQITTSDGRTLERTITQPVRSL